jgi:endonuclease/exonuclease/phosphatase family metal-dependent hydrolase
MMIRVLTLNLWNVNEPLQPRFSALTAGLQVLKPDIVCLQEVARDPCSGHPQSDIVAKACDLAHAVDKDALSIVSRFPIMRSQSTLLPEFPGDEPRQVLLAECLIGDRPLLVANTHLVYLPGYFAERKAQADAALAAIARFSAAAPADAKILCGDFNDLPGSPAVRLVLERGFRDMYPQCNPDISGVTFSCTNPYVDPLTHADWRIDYIFASGDLTPTTCSVVFDGRDGLRVASDHFGVFCTLAFP